MGSDNQFGQGNISDSKLKEETADGVDTKDTSSIEQHADIENMNFLGKLRHSHDYRIRFLHTCFVVWMFITLGWVVSVVGGTFPDLRLIIDKDLETASWIFTLGSFGYMLGSFLGGILFDRINRLLLLVGVTTLSAFAVTAYPWCNTFPAMLAVSFFSGLFTGGIDVGGNAHIASIWGQGAAPFMQTIHFGFSFGGILSPLTAEPFLAPKYCSEVSNTSMSTFATTTVTGNSTTQSTECKEKYGDTHIHYAYAIAGAVSLSAAVPFLVLYLLSNKHYTYVNTPIALSRTKQTQLKTLPTLTLQQKILFVALLMLLISVYACVEGRFSSLLTTFLADYLHWSTTEGLHVTSVFWGTFAAGRFLGILVTRFLKTQTMLLVYLIALTAVFVGMLFAASYQVRELVWACAAMAGLSMSVIFPAIFTWTAENILRVTGTISSTYLVGVSVFNMLFPLLFGYLMDNFTQMYYIYLLIGQCIFSLILYISIRVLVKIYIDQSVTDNDEQKSSP